MRIVMSWLNILRRIGQQVGPYLMLEMLLPGGTLFALLLFAWRRRNPDLGKGARQAVGVMKRALENVLEPRILAPIPVSTTVRASYPQCSTTVRSKP